MKIGLVIMLSEREELKRAYNYAETREFAQRAEAIGYDSLWLYDHLLYRKEDRSTIGIWECWTILSALSEATRRVELGTLVLCNSFRNPALLAKMATTLDEVSGGRLILGIGAGWNKPEYDAFGIPFDHRVSRFEEALQIIRPLLKDGRVDFQGKYYQALDCEIRPRGPRLSGPPLMVGASAERMLRLTAQYADLWNTGYLGQPDTLEKPRAELLEACRATGRDPTTLGVTVMIAVAFPKLLKKEPSFEYPPLQGTPKQIAQALQAYAKAGVQHVMLHLVPYSPQAMTQMEKALQIYRDMTQP